MSLRSGRFLSVALLLLSLGCSGGVTAGRSPAPSVTLSVEWAGASALDVEQQVTQPLEVALAPEPGLVRMASTSAEGEARLELGYPPGTDEAVAAEGVLEALQRLATLPDGAGPPMLRIGRPVRVGSVVTPCPAGPCALDEELRRRLERLPGVAHVAPRGHARQELGVQLDARRLTAYGLSADQVVAALEAAPPAESPDALADTVLAAPAGVPVLLRDVARLTVEVRYPAGRARSGVEPVVVLDVLASDPGLDTAPLRSAAGPAGARFVAASAEQVLSASAPGEGEEVGRVLSRVAEVLLEEHPGAELLAVAPAPGRAGELRIRGSSAAADAAWRLLLSTPGIEVERDGAVRRVVELIGDDREALERAAVDLEGVLSRLPGLDRLSRYPGPGAPELRVELDRAAAAAYGIREADLARALRLARGRTLDRSTAPAVVVRLGSLDRPDDLRDVPVPVRGADGAPPVVPLGHVARIEQVAGWSALLRIDGRPALQLVLTPAEPGPTEADLLAAIQGVELPVGVSVGLAR